MTNSPGTKLKFRLPMAISPGWAVFGTLTFCLIWNGIVAALVATAVRSYIAGEPDWLLTLFTIPLAAIGIWAIVALVRQLLVTTGIGPTLVEISDHPLCPGGQYRVFLSQSGWLTVNRLRVLLVCEEVATYRQGTDTRSETREVFRRELFRRDSFEIRGGMPFECDIGLNLPGGPCTPSPPATTKSPGRSSSKPTWPAGPSANGLSRDCPSGHARPATMNHEPTVVIRLEGDRRVHWPGETLSGEYHVESLEAGQVKAIELSVLWRTEGKGDEDMAVHAFWRRDADDDRPIDPQPEQFSATLPNSPLSYYGQIVKVLWCVRVRVFLHRGKEIVGEKGFQLGDVPPVGIRTPEKEPG